MSGMIGGKFFIAFVLGVFLTFPANATPPNLVCRAGNEDSAVRFVLPLSTSYSSFYRSGVMPLSMVHAEFEFDEGEERQELDFYSDHIIGQWLMDGRVDLRLFLEEVNGQGQATGYDLIVRTISTGETSEESGQIIHKGNFVFRVVNGFAMQGGTDTVLELSGKVECS
ncbi:MAG TPA: hypothetical protein ENK61_07200 [Devosia sp.]|nr:hypothetical protein [Devosia sp.]